MATIIPKLTPERRQQIWNWINAVAPNYDERIHALETALAIKVGSMSIDAACTLNELRALWIEERELGADFMTLPQLERVRSFVHPPTGRLLKPWVLTDAELLERFTFAT